MASDHSQQGDNGNGGSFLQALIDTIPTPIFYKDLQGRYLGCNVAFAEFLGRPREQIVGRTVSQVWDQASADTYAARDAEILREESTRQSYEYRTRRADGQLRDVLFHKAPLHDEEGRLSGLVGTMMDITDRKNAERQLSTGQKKLSNLVGERTSELQEANRQLIREIAERRRAEEKLRRTQEFIREALDALEDPFFIKDEQHRWVMLNRMSCELMGHPREELIGKSDYDLFPPEQAEVFWANDEKAFREGKLVTEENITWHDRLYHISTSKSVYVDPTTDKRYLVGTIRDVTDLQETQEDLRRTQERLWAILETSPDLIFVLDANGVYVDIFTSGSDLLVAPAEEMIGQRYQDLLPPELREIVAPPLERALETGQTQTVEYALTNEEGELTWQSASVARFLYGGKMHAVVTVRDITDRVQAEQAARDSEQRLRIILESSPDLMFVLNTEGRYMEIFTAQSELLAAPADELLGRTIHEVLPEEIATVCQGIVDAAIETGRPQTHEYDLVLPSGEQRWFQARVARFETDNGPRVIWAARDITDRVQAEQAARRSEQRFQEALQRSSHVLYRYDAAEDRYEYLSDCVEDIFGWPKEEFLRFGWTETMEHTHPDDLPLLHEFTEEYFHPGASGVQRGIEYRRRTASGKYIWLRDHPTPIFRDGELVAIVGSVYDITDRKRAEQRALESEARFQEALRHSQSILYRFNLVTDRYEYLSDSVETCSGFSVEEYREIGAEAFLDSLHPDDREEVVRQLLRQPNPEDRDQLQAVLQYRRCTRTGQYRWFMDWATLFYEDGELVAIAGSAYDITDQRQAQEELRRAHDELERRVEERTAELAASEERWRSIVETAPDHVLFVDPDGVVLYINRSYADLSPEEVIGLPIGYFADPEYREVLNGELRKVIEGAESSGCEALSAGLTGPPRWFSVRFGPVRRDGQTVGATLIAQDITERKATEEALHNVQRRLMQVQEDERRRLAADLHDSVSQMLFALQMRLKRLRNRCDECARQEDLDEAIDQCNQLIRETRAVYRGLYPPGLVQLGLVSALRQLARDFEQTTEVNVTCCEIVENSRFDDDVEIALFRIAQEAVRNAVRHGHADNIGVDLEMNGDALTLTVADDGGGFDVRQPNTGSLGLRTMQERAVSIGGTFSLESSPTGTTLEVSVPATPRPAVPGQ